MKDSMENIYEGPAIKAPYFIRTSCIKTVPIYAPSEDGYDLGGHLVPILTNPRMSLHWRTFGMDSQIALWIWFWIVLLLELQRWMPSLRFPTEFPKSTSISLELPISTGRSDNIGFYLLDLLVLDEAVSCLSGKSIFSSYQICLVYIISYPKP